MTTREQIVSAAREYLRTPFKHQGRMKHVAMDCAGLPLCVAEDLGLSDRLGVPFNRLEFPNYPRQFVGEMAYQELQRRFIERPAGSMPRPGDLVSLFAPDDPCHIAIVGNYLGSVYPKSLSLIQALQIKLGRDSGSGRVVEHRLDEGWRKRIKAAFAFPGVE